jgi:hypothetical protein
LSQSILRGVYYPRPSERYLEVERVPVAGACPECASEELRRYPAFTAGGPRMVTKCGACLFLVSAERPEPSDLHPPFWPMTRMWGGTRAG